MSNTTAITSTGGTDSSTSSLSKSQLNMKDFLLLMTTQMQNQDPLQPMSNSEFFSQMAQLGTVQGMDQLNGSAQIQQAQSLMGKTVTAANDSAATGGTATITGVVKSLSIQNGAYYLGVQTPDGNITNVPMSALQTVQQTPDLSSLGNLVGKTVSGTVSLNGQSAIVSGSVTGVGLTNGVPTVTVQVSKGKTANINVSDLTSISD